MKNIITFCAFCISTLITYGCQIVPIANLEDNITYYYQTDSEINKSEYLTIWIQNRTNKCISFPPDFGARIFAETESGEIEVPNLMKVIGDKEWIFDPQNEISLENPLNLRPNILELSLSKPTNFYVLISGHLCNDEQTVINKKIPFTVTP